MGVICALIKVIIVYLFVLCQGPVKSKNNKQTELQGKFKTESPYQMAKSKAQTHQINIKQLKVPYS